MKAQLIGFILFFTVLTQCVALNAKSLFLSSPADISQAREISKNTGKKIFVRFSATWCAPCQAFEQNLASDSLMNEWLTESFVVLNSDIDTKSGEILRLEFNIQSLPSFLILDQDGNEITRRSKTMGLAEMKRYLSTYATNYKPNSSSQTSRPGSTAPKTDEVFNSSNTNPTNSDVVHSPLSSPASFWQVQVKKVAMSGFGVQLGVYSSHEKAMIELNRLSALLVEQTLCLYAKATGPIVQYRILAGPFEDQNEARNASGSIKLSGIESVVKDLASL
jgi:thiol-disulfide isomerase/thioredoxin